MSEAYIIDAVRTAIGKKGGALSATHPADLGAGVLTHLLERTEIDPHGVDDVIFGCVDAIGPQAGNIARTSWLAAGLPVEVPGVTVDRQCGSSQQGGALRRSGSDERYGGSRCCRWSAEHERDTRSPRR